MVDSSITFARSNLESIAIEDGNLAATVTDTATSLEAAGSYSDGRSWCSERIGNVFVSEI